jgi:hypothetical protein
MVEHQRSVPLASAARVISDVFVADQVDPDSLLVGVADLHGLGALTDSPRRLSDHAGKLGRLQRFEPEDLLVPATGAGQARVWLADRDGYCTTSLAVLRPNGLLDPRVLLWWLRARGIRRAGKRLELAREWITLPSKAEELASAMLVLDRLESVIGLRWRTLEMTRRLGPALFQQRLGNPLDEHGAWPMLALGDVIGRPETGWSPKCAERPAYEGEWGVIKVSAVSSGRFRADENKALPPSTPPRERLALHAGDLLMVRSNSRSLVGATALVTEDHPRLLFTDKVWRLRPGEGLDPRFLKALLSQPAVRERLSQMATGNLTSMQNLTQARLLALPIALPTPSAQAAHVADLEAIEGAERAQSAQAAQLAWLESSVLLSTFPRASPDAPAPSPEQEDEELVIERALFAELSPLQQSIWRALVRADRELTMPELSRRLTREHQAPGVDRLRRALDLLSAAGVATRSEDARAYRWSQAQPFDPVAAS